MSAQRIEEVQADSDQAHMVLDASGGNALAALRSVIADAEFLCDQLETAVYISVAGSPVVGSRRFHEMTDGNDRLHF